MSLSSFLSLPGGGCRSFYARSGDHVVCLEGRIAVSEARAGGLDVYQRVESALQAGEAYCFHEASVVTLQVAPGQPPDLFACATGLARAVQHLSKWCMIRFIRRGVEQSGSSSGS